jgi:hypothetical protein
MQRDSDVVIARDVVIVPAIVVSMVTRVTVPDCSDAETVMPPRARRRNVVDQSFGHAGKTSIEVAVTVETKPQYLALVTADYIWKLNHHRYLDFSLKVDNALNNRDVRYYTTVQRPPGGNVTNPARVATLAGYG